MKSLKKPSEQRKGLKLWDQWDGTVHAVTFSIIYAFNIPAPLIY